MDATQSKPVYQRAACQPAPKYRTTTCCFCIAGKVWTEYTDGTEYESECPHCERGFVIREQRAV